MATITKKQLNQLISKGRTEQALDLLDNATRNDSYLNQQVLLQKSRYSGFKRDKTTGVRSTADLELESNRINAALLQLTDQLPDNVNVTMPVKEIIYEIENKDNHQPFLWIGTALLAIGVALAIIFRCELDGFAQYATLLLLAVSVGFLARYFTGNLNISILNKNVTATGAFALTVLILLVSPAKEFISNSCEPFTFTAKIKTESPSSQYPPLENARLELFVKDDWKSAEIQPNGLADFKGIDPKFDNQRVEARFTADYWKLKNDSILLVPNRSNQLLVVPDGSLGQVNGRVKDANGKPLADVAIDLGKPYLTAISNAQGYFRIEVPLKDQRIRYSMTALEKGYEIWELDIDPTQELVEVGLQEK